MSLIGYNIIAQGGYLQRQYRFLLSRVYKISPIGSFSSLGILIDSTVPLDPYAVTENGLNVMDIALFVGTPFVFSPHLGDLIWASNNWIEKRFIPSTTAPVSINQVTQTFDGTSHTLKSVIDENTARKITSEFFVQQSGLLGFPWEIDAGEIDITFSADMKSLTGAATFISDGYVGPGTFAWAATFTGNLATPVLRLAAHDFDRRRKFRHPLSEQQRGGRRLVYGRRHPARRDPDPKRRPKLAHPSRLTGAGIKETQSLRLSAPRATTEIWFNKKGPRITTYLCDGLHGVTVVDGVQRLEFHRLDAVQRGSTANCS